MDGDDFFWGEVGDFHASFRAMRRSLSSSMNLLVQAMISGRTEGEDGFVLEMLT